MENRKSSGLVGDTFVRNIFYIEGESSLASFRAMISTMEAEAIGSGASRISIYGASVVNEGFLSEAIASRFGYTLEQSGYGVFLTKSLIP